MSDIVTHNRSPQGYGKVARFDAHVQAYRAWREAALRAYFLMTFAEGRSESAPAPARLADFGRAS